MQLFLDYLPVVAFFVAYQQADIYTATVVLMVTMPLVPVGHWLITRKVGRMHLLSTALVLVLGGATLALRAPMFVIWKPTVLYWLMALACAGSLFIGTRPLIERMLGGAVELSRAQWRQITLLWSAFFLFAGGANLYVAYFYSEKTWVTFKLFGLIGITLAFVILQGIWMAVMLSRNERAAAGERGRGAE